MKFNILHNYSSLDVSQHIPVIWIIHVIEHPIYIFLSYSNIIYKLLNLNYVKSHILACLDYHLSLSASI